MVNDSTVAARAIVEELINAGMRHAVIAPGSRSAPVSWALAQAEQAGLIKLHVRIDERDAGFLALGISKASMQLVAVVVTSGTAVANLYPAVVEAHQSAVSLVVISADRPSDSRGTTAPQTILQPDFFKGYVNAAIDLDCSEGINNRALVVDLLHQAQTPRRGPVQLNVQFQMPLMPDAQELSWYPEVKPTKPVLPVEPVAEQLALPSHGLVIVGDVNDEAASLGAGKLAQELGWPLIWEPTSGAHNCANALSHGVLLLNAKGVPQIDAVITIGTVGLSRSVLKLLQTTPAHYAVHLNSAGPAIPDPANSATRVLSQIPTASCAVDETWLQSWLVADGIAHEEIQLALSGNTLSGPSVATAIWDFAKDEDQLVVSASWPVRHLEAYAGTRAGLRVLGNRGANGIDGLISTAWGVATTLNAQTYLLIGDIAFLHDLGGLNVAQDEQLPNLTIVIIDNDGGGIFSQLEQSADTYKEHYERIFGTPHGKDLWVIAESLGIAASRVTTMTELHKVLPANERIPGVHVIVCSTGSRVYEAQLIKDISTSISQLAWK